MKPYSVHIVGCGDLGIRLGERLHRTGLAVSASRRDSSQLPDYISAYRADYCVSGGLDFLAQLSPDIVVVFFKPTASSAAGYRRGFVEAMKNLLAGLGRHRPKCILMASSVRVYAQSEGAWVEEYGSLSTNDPGALAIIAAEELLAGCTALATSIIRFAGIYGGAQSRLIQRVRTGELCPAEPLYYSNRIHREDCAGFMAHLIEKICAGDSVLPLYIAVDNTPVPQHEVESWLAARMGVLDRRTQRVQRPRGHKRCCNRALRESGYILLHPDYRSGYDSVR